MTLASTSNVQVQYKPESTYGTILGSGKYFDLRVTSESLDFAVSKTVSSELNATRSVSSQVATTASASGGVQGEFSHGEFDRLMASCLQSAFTGGSGVVNGVWSTGATTLAFNTGTSTITFSVSSSAVHGIVAGQWFRLYKVGTANNGKLFRATSVTTTTIVVDANTPLSADTTAGAWDVQAIRLTHGTTRTSFSIQRNVNGLSPVEYLTYRGMTPSKLSLNIASGSLTTVGFDFLGKDVQRANPVGTNPFAAGSTYVASLTHPIHSGTTSTNCILWVGGAPLTSTYVKSIGLEFDNALGTQEAVCTLGAVGIRSGTINCTVSMQLYFAEGAAFFDQFIANTNTEIVFSSTDSNGNSYLFTLPSASVATYKVNAGGKDTDLLVDVTLTALRGGTVDKVITIDRCGTAVDLAVV